MSEYKELDKELQDALKLIIETHENEERAVRERQIRLWKKLEYYWSGFTRIFWDSVAHDWRIYNDTYYSNDNDNGYYDKQVNVFQAYLETIIAALSSTVPAVKCAPDDADNELDNQTAAAGTNIAKLIYLHNDAPLLWVRALWTYCTQGMVAAYTHTIESEKFGSVSTEETEDYENEVEQKLCPICGMVLQPQDEMKNNQELDEFDPGIDDILFHDILLNDGQMLCTNCMQAVDPEIRKTKMIMTRVVGVIDQPKARQRIEVNGGLFVSVPNYARTQEECPYVAYNYETHYTNVYKEFPHLRGKFNSKDGGETSTPGSSMQYERWGRLSPQYFGEYPTSTPTVRKWWIRANDFDQLEEETAKKLKKLFPDGAKATWVNEEFAEACNESLDDHWTLSYNPRANYVHYDPLGLLLVSMQDITQDLFSLTLQTIEHGVPQTFVNPKFLDFDAYRDTEVVVGGVYPTKPVGSGSISDGFYTTSTAQLSQEVGPFFNQVQEMAQFTSGAVPSLFGGAQPGSSRTAAQYSMSRNQALQRLQTTWKQFNYWWKNVFGKVIPAYAASMLEDERMVEKSTGDKYINVWIRRSQLEGKIGNVELESSDQLPMTFGQIRDVMMELIQLNNPAILQMLFGADNLGVVSEYLGLEGVTVPGEIDREKQLDEITSLLKAGPIQGPDGQEMPSIMPEFEVDNHKVEADICRTWLVGEVGRMTRTDNEQGYRNVLLHMKIHTQMFQALQSMQMQQAQGQESQGSGQPPQGDQNNPKSKLRPVKKEQNNAA